MPQQDSILCFNSLTFEKVNQMPPTAVASVGDAVYSLLARTKVVMTVAEKGGGVHRAASAIVNAISQSEAAERVLDKLSEQESYYFRRCQNAHTYNKPRGCSHSQYRRATGLEGLFGMLYLTGNSKRIDELFAICAGEKQE